jgi:hypothetical protein
MHHYRSRTSAFIVLVAAVMVLGVCLSVPAAIAALILGLVLDEMFSMHMGLAFASAALILSVIRWWVGRSTFCPLCKTPVLGDARCSTHRHARRLFGSLRHYVAMTCIFRLKFICPYCNEQTSLRSEKNDQIIGSA